MSSTPAGSESAPDTAIAPRSSERLATPYSHRATAESVRLSLSPNSCSHRAAGAPAGAEAIVSDTADPGTTGASASSRHCDCPRPGPPAPQRTCGSPRSERTGRRRPGGSAGMEPLCAHLRFHPSGHTGPCCIRDSTRQDPTGPIASRRRPRPDERSPRKRSSGYRQHSPTPGLRVRPDPTAPFGGDADRVSRIGSLSAHLRFDPHRIVLVQAAYVWLRVRRSNDVWRIGTGLSLLMKLGSVRPCLTD
jgi:hypothetical protein